MVDTKKLGIDSEATYLSFNKTLYISKINENEIDKLSNIVVDLVNNKSCNKIVLKSPVELESNFINKGFYREAYIPDYFSDGKGCSFLSYIDNFSSFINGEYRFIKNRLLELITVSSEADLEDPEKKLVELKLNKKQNDKVLDDLVFLFFNDIQNNSNSKEIPKGLKIIGTEEKSTKPLMLFYHDKNYSNLEILEILPKNRSLISSLINYCENYAKKNKIELIHMLADIENPDQNFIFKQSDYNYGGTIIAKQQDGKPKRNFNVWYKKL